MATLIGQLKWPRSALSLADRLRAFGEAGELDINGNYAAMVREARDAMLLQWLCRWREWHHQQPIVRGARVVGLRRTNRAAGLCLAGVAGVMLAVTGCSVAPESRSAQAPLAATLAKARLDPVAATAELNAYRAEKGMNPLRLDPALTAMAERQAKAMAQSGTMSHDVGGSFSARLAASGINAPTGENLGAGYMSFDEALAGWRASPGHDANLLMSGATRFGIALAKNPRDAYGAYWAMEVGAEPRSGGAPVAVWLFPLPIVVIEPR